MTGAAPAVAQALAQTVLPRPDRRLAAALERLRADQPVVLALPRGGVVVGAEVARALVAPLDVLVVDEASMVALPLMAKTLRALRPDARLVLVGDKDQLASVEAETGPLQAPSGRARTWMKYCSP